MPSFTLRAVAVPLTILLAAAALILGSTALRVGAADHLDAPTVKTDGRIDINDLYVFQGHNAANTALGTTAAGASAPIARSSASKYK